MAKFYHFAQGSTEWIAARVGIPTASNFDKIITPGGKPSTQRDKFLRELLAELILGHAIQDVTTAMMQRGRDEEPNAVRYYEMVAGVDTEPIGFVTNDEGTFGASPDRLVGEDGLLECKCPGAATHVEYLLSGVGASQAYRVQVQGQLYVAERKWSDTLSFHPGMPDALYRVERDDKFIGFLAEQLNLFVSDLALLRERAMNEGWIKEKAPEPESPIDPSLFLTDEDIEFLCK